MTLKGSLHISVMLVTQEGWEWPQNSKHFSPCPLTQACSYHLEYHSPDQRAYNTHIYIWTCHSRVFFLKREIEEFLECYYKHLFWGKDDLLPKSICSPAFTLSGAQDVFIRPMPNLAHKILSVHSFQDLVSLLAQTSNAIVKVQSIITGIILINNLKI